MPPSAGALGLVGTQDYAAIRGQGRIVDRSRERLMSSDAGIALLRKIFARELSALQAGRPTKAWAKLDEGAHLLAPGENPELVASRP